MANAITAHTIQNGSRNLILQYNIIADGSGDYSDFNLLNILDYTGDDARQPNNYRVMKVSGRNGTGTSFQLKFGNSIGDHKLFFESVIENEFYQEWQNGLSPTLAAPDMSIRISTSGFDAASDTISLVIWVKKKVQLDNA